VARAAIPSGCWSDRARSGVTTLLSSRRVTTAAVAALRLPRLGGRHRGRGIWNEDDPGPPRVEDRGREHVWSGRLPTIHIRDERLGLTEQQMLRRICKANGIAWKGGA